MSDAAPNGDQKPKTFGKPIQPGQVLNPAGRPKGSRNKLGELFIQALQESFEKQGIDAINRVIAERPADYLKIVASLLPKELHIRDNALDEMNDDELDGVVTAIRSAKARQARVADAARAVAAKSQDGPDRVH